MTTFAAVLKVVEVDVVGYHKCEGPAFPDGIKRSRLPLTKPMWLMPRFISIRQLLLHESSLFVNRGTDIWRWFEFHEKFMLCIFFYMCFCHRNKQKKRKKWIHNINWMQMQFVSAGWENPRAERQRAWLESDLDQRRMGFWVFLVSFRDFLKIPFSFQLLNTFILNWIWTWIGVRKTMSARKCV